MREPYDEARYRELLGASFLHKLTYKKVQPQDMTEATLLGHLLRDGAPSA
jgi:hypothetical protein